MVRHPSDMAVHNAQVVKTFVVVNFASQQRGLKEAAVPAGIARMLGNSGCSVRGWAISRRAKNIGARWLFGMQRAASCVTLSSQFVWIRISKKEFSVAKKGKNKVPFPHAKWGISSLFSKRTKKQVKRKVALSVVVAQDDLRR